MNPNEFIGEKVEYDDMGQLVWRVSSEGKKNLLLQVRGWGGIQNKFDTEEQSADFQDKLGEWITEAINEKLEREAVDATIKSPVSKDIAGYYKENGMIEVESSVYPLEGGGFGRAIYERSNNTYYAPAKSVKK